ncbi:sensor histidine kinase [Brevundimonas goettingensis]|uniref:histidine kinase n=1 Tax=Brevundimonas goettingensis TaxID=2774190 RepID=A0A975GWI7_9CAUL|nr:sensor histidine kinase [Brevundimonas goettingensis]QTC92652.1 sensor histidine kinase [Brevundimonas goettingensis]
MTANADVQIADLRRRLLDGYQLLQALVGIRLRRVTDPESRRHMTWLSDVTAAMTLLNRRISEEGPVDFAAYLGDAAGFWRRSVEDRGVRIEVRAAKASVADTHALPLAIIVHELVSNAVRHAFPDGRRGSIAIACSLASGGVSLVVRDSGVGAEELTPGDGLSLVEGLVEHLGGQMSIETAPGAGVGVRVRLPLSGDAVH